MIGQVLAIAGGVVFNGIAAGYLVQMAWQRRSRPAPASKTIRIVTEALAEG